MSGDPGEQRAPTGPEAALDRKKRANAERLAAALRANLKRRKAAPDAARGTSPAPAGKE